MKISTALFFVAVGIWIAYTYPEFSVTAFEYINQAFYWAKDKFAELMGAVS